MVPHALRCIAIAVGGGGRGGGKYFPIVNDRNGMETTCLFFQLNI